MQAVQPALMRSGKHKLLLQDHPSVKRQCTGSQPHPVALTHRATGATATQRGVKRPATTVIAQQHLRVITTPKALPPRPTAQPAKMPGLPRPAVTAAAANIGQAAAAPVRNAAMVHRGRFRLIRESPRNQSLLRRLVRRASLSKHAAQHRQPRQPFSGACRCAHAPVQPGSRFWSARALHVCPVLSG